MNIKVSVFKFLYYFLNFLIVFVVILVVVWPASQVEFWKREIHSSINTLISEIKDQELKPDFILSQIKPEENAGQISLLAVGDIMLSRVVGQKMLKHGYDYPFSKLKPVTGNADLTFGNLETAVLPGRIVQTGEMMFRSDPESLQSLAEAGFDVVSLANNHTPNYGQNGLTKTFEYLKEYGIDYVGAGENYSQAYAPLIKEVQGIKLAFLAYNDSDVVPGSYEAGKDWAGTAIMNVKALKAGIEAVRDKADLVIVSMHSGTEYVYFANQRQEEFAHAAIDAGADLVIGHHPHVVQEMEEYKGKYIFYSLGNYIFDQMWSEETRQGEILKLALTRQGIEEFMFIPVVIEDYARPRLASAGEADIINSRLNHELEMRQILIYEDKSYKINKYPGLFKNVEEKDYWYFKTEDEINGLVYLDRESERAYVLIDNEIVWISDSKWGVKDAAVGDVNYDDQDDVSLIVWKKGNYGSDMPFWEKENSQDTGNHLFVFTWQENEFKPLWQSSTIKKPNIDLLIHDLDGDNKNELIVLEDHNNDLSSAEHLAIWRWDDWGFSNVWRSELGELNSLKNVLEEVVVD